MSQESQVSANVAARTWAPGGVRLYHSSAMSNLLFPGKWRQTDDIEKAAIETPLGTVRLEALIAGSHLNSDQANTYASVFAEARLFVWNKPAVVVELMMCKMRDEPDVTACHAAMWRIRAERQPVTDCVLTCRIEGASEYDHGPCSGQFLDAQEWSAGITNVKIGVPQVDFTQYVTDGFVLEPPNLEPGQLAQFQFIVAWAPEPEGDYATWMALIQPPAHILSILGEEEG